MKSSEPSISPAVFCFLSPGRPGAPLSAVITQGADSSQAVRRTYIVYCRGRMDRTCVLFLCAFLFFSAHYPCLRPRVMHTKESEVAMVTINGKQEEAAGMTILAYLQQAGYAPERIVVERNLDIIPAMSASASSASCSAPTDPSSTADWIFCGLSLLLSEKN